MRIDEIDLFGPILVNGSTGSNGQVFGFSGSQITWITASSSGSGLPGPQGPVGTGLFITQDQIALGGATGLTSTSFFKICGTNIIHGSASVSGNRNTILGSHQFTNPSGYQNSINGNNYNTILGGAQLSIANSFFSIIGGGNNVTLTYQKYSGGFGGFENQISSNIGYGCFNTILAGRNNIIQNANLGGASKNTTILGSYASQIDGGVTCFTSIIGSDSSTITPTSPKVSNSNAIIGGGYNLFLDVEYEYSSAIIGGNGNKICNSNFALGLSKICNSVIIASKDSNSCTNRGVIISGDTKNLGLLNCQGPIVVTTQFNDNVIIGSGRIGNYSMFNAYTNTNAEFCPGTFFYRINVGKGNCFVVYCGYYPGQDGKELTICF